MRGKEEPESVTRPELVDIVAKAISPFAFEGAFWTPDTQPGQRIAQQIARDEAEAAIRAIESTLGRLPVKDDL